MRHRTLSPGPAPGVLSVLVLLTACATPLEQAVEADAPGFRVKAPARANPELGRHLDGEQTAAVECFAGTEQAEPVDSWSERVLEYDGVFSANLDADFGSTVTVTGDADSDRSVRLRLMDVGVVRLDNPYAIGCAELTSETRDLEGGETMAVITQAMIAGTIEIEQDGSRGLELGVDTDVVDGSLDLDSDRRDVWKGTELYFADLPEEYVVRRTSAEGELASGSTLDAGSCGFTLRAISQTSWSGDVSCRNVSGSQRMSGAPGDYQTAEVANGISVSVRIRNPRLSKGLVEVHRFELVAAR